MTSYTGFLPPGASTTGLFTTNAAASIQIDITAATTPATPVKYFSSPGIKVEMLTALTPGSLFNYYSFNPIAAPLPGAPGNWLLEGSAIVAANRTVTFFLTHLSDWAVTAGPTGNVTGTIAGEVLDNSTGNPIAGATVAHKNLTSTTGLDGKFAINDVVFGTDLVVNISKTGYVSGSKVVNLYIGGISRIDVALLPLASTVTFNPGTATTLTVPGSPAQVNLPANALMTASGSLPVGLVTAQITPIDPTSNPQIMPGNFTTTNGNIESFGAMQVDFTDNTGAALTSVADGLSATIRIPVAQGVAAPPATMDAYYYDSTYGKWIKEGTLTLGGVAPNKYYSGTVTHFSTWNADYLYQSTCISGKVVDGSGVGIAGARVDAQGQSYVGNSSAWTNASGNYSILVKPSSTVLLSARNNTGTSQTLIQSSGATSACTGATANLVINSTTTGGSARVKLTWGANPSDLDSHLTGPILGSLSRFHVYYAAKGTLNASPYAELDVDDTTSFGPEVVTVSKFIPGVYRYSVHHYSGSGTIFTSPARVELNLNGATTVFTPPTPSVVLGVNSVWQVFELNVDASGNITVSRLNNYTSSSSFGVTGATSGNGSYEEYLFFSNMPSK